jgi:hypothetical protein
MCEIRTVTTLRRKRKQIAANIQLYEWQIAQSRADLAHIEAAIAIFAATGSREQMTCYVDTHRLFRRGEPMELCRAALATGPTTTRELALHVMKAKGLNPADTVLATSVRQQLVHVLRMQWKRGRIVRTGKVLGVSIWALGGPD